MKNNAEQEYNNINLLDEKRKNMIKFCMIYSSKQKYAQTSLRMFILDKS